MCYFGLMSTIVIHLALCFLIEVELYTYKKSTIIGEQVDEFHELNTPL